MVVAACVHLSFSLEEYEHQSHLKEKSMWQEQLKITVKTTPRMRKHLYPCFCKSLGGLHIKVTVVHPAAIRTLAIMKFILGL